MSIPREFPENHAQLYDLLQKLFGIGNYDDVVAKQAWHNARMGEISRLKALCKRRRATEKQVAVAAWYAHENGHTIRHSYRLFPLIPEAMRSYNQAVAAELRTELTEQIAAAYADAVEAGQHEWAERLIATPPENARCVLAEWKATR